MEIKLSTKILTQENPKKPCCFEHMLHKKTKIVKIGNNLTFDTTYDIFRNEKVCLLGFRSLVRYGAFVE